MTYQNYNPNKREYEDLDEICSASTDCIQDYGLYQFRNKPHKFLSDTAINLTPEKIHAKKLAEQIAVRDDITGSIPCLFRLETNLPNLLLDKSNRNTKSGEQAAKVLKKNKKYRLWLISYIVLYGIYLVSGAFWFRLIEAPAEYKIQAQFIELRKEFLTKYPQINEYDLDNIVKAVVSATNTGIRITTNTTASTDINWSFGDLLLFTTSLVTTIGYGHLSPITDMGKIFCVLYAAIGIPLTLVLLSTMVEHLFKQSNKLLKVLITKLGHAHQIFSIQILHLSILAAIFLIVFLIIPAVIFASLESEWTFLDGFYFCFTSLTTIGLGDLVPDADNVQPFTSLYKIMTSIYLIIGLIAIMLVITVFYTIPQLNIGLWLIENNSTEMEKISPLKQKSSQKFNNETNIPKIKIESTTSSSKTLRTIV